MVNFGYKWNVDYLV